MEGSIQSERATHQSINDDEETLTENEEFSTEKTQQSSTMSMQSFVREKIFANAERDFKNLKVIEVCGVASSTDGRTCDEHVCCGYFVRVSDKLVCKWQYQVLVGKPAPEQVVKVHLRQVDPK